MKPLLTSVWVSVLLFGCDSTQPPLTEHDAKPSQAIVTPPAHSNRETPQEGDADSVVAQPEGEEKPKKKLNLSLLNNLADSASAKPLAEEQGVLPDMFATQESRTHLSGGLHRDEENPDLLDSVDGAEISIEIKID